MSGQAGFLQSILADKNIKVSRHLVKEKRRREGTNLFSFAPYKFFCSTKQKRLTKPLRNTSFGVGILSDLHIIALGKITAKAIKIQRKVQLNSALNRTVKNTIQIIKVAINFALKIATNSASKVGHIVLSHKNNETLHFLQCVAFVCLSPSPDTISTSKLSVFSFFTRWCQWK